MDKEQFDRLDQGDVIRDKQGNSWVVMGSAGNGKIVSRTIVASNGEDWETLSKNEINQPAQGEARGQSR